MDLSSLTSLPLGEASHHLHIHRQHTLSTPATNSALGGASDLSFPTLIPAVPINKALLCVQLSMLFQV